MGLLSRRDFLIKSAAAAASAAGSLAAPEKAHGFFNFLGYKAPGSTSSPVLLMNMNGTAGSNTFTDVFGNSLSNSGTPQIASGGKFNQCGNFATGFVRFNNINALKALAQDFTLELWYRQDTFSGELPDLVINGITQHDNYAAIVIAGGALYMSQAGTGWDQVISLAPVAGTWQHLAVCRPGANIRTYIDGSVVSTWAIGAGVPLCNGNFNNVGRYFTGVGRQGHFDELRYEVGSAKYTGSSFTVPTSEYMS
jgi:hypothetical protein